MKPFWILLAAFGLALAVLYIVNHDFNVGLAGKIALSCMLIFTSVGHFKFTKGMSLMLFDFIPHKSAVIIWTGILEIIATISLFINNLQKITGILLIVFFILILPCNIYASAKRLNYETGKFDRKGISYLCFRIPFQLLLIFWAYYFIVKNI